MFANRRKSERRACRSIAKIQLGTGLPRDCVITDISDGGVKVIAEHPGNSTRIHHHPVGRPSTAMPVGLANRLRVRRPVRRLDQFAHHPCPALLQRPNPPESRADPRSGDTDGTS